MKSKYAIIFVLIFIVAAGGAIAIVGGASRGAAQTTSTVHALGKFSQSFCLNSGNASAQQIAIENGITCFRTDIGLNQNEMSFISNTSNEGAQYLGILDYATLGVQIVNGSCVSKCNWTLNDWNASVENAIADYPEVHTWEIWNEPLVPIFSSGYENMSALNYYKMIRSAYTIIKARRPNDTVVCFGGAFIFPFSDVQAEYPFYLQVWNYGASKYCDAISLHSYTLPYYNLTQPVYSSGADIESEYNYTLNLFENMTRKPIWITETGTVSNNGTSSVNDLNDQQAAFLTQEFNFFSRYPFVKRVYWFHLADSYGQGQNYGLLDNTLQPKPAWYSFLYFVKNETSPNATV